ncbi:CDP-2,3-bis-(O-geranylgeranyl)-sn-glycerol synthase [Candidatus Thorarchaeota archaeon]|nr:MAG: CDP-2,3-bis-(O-geranylgeranyl)-sn-glycerol synthase [Candidatus Thorarchaeota archaeon]
MYEEIAIIELALWLGLPAWIANSTPVVFGGGAPIDGGKRFRDGRRILGDGKTIRGFLVGVLFGTLTGIGQVLVAPFLFPILSEYVVVTAEMEAILFMSLPTAVLLSIGALLGDMGGSFLKRRVGLQSGGPAPVLDQLGFIIAALALASPVIQPSAIYVIVLISVTLLTHWISNVAGYLLGFKDNPW